MSWSMVFERGQKLRVIEAQNAELQRQLADANRLLAYRDARNSALCKLVEESKSIIADAIRERDQYKAACEMATALRPLGAVQVVEGGAAVLLDTSKGAA